MPIPQMPLPILLPRKPLPTPSFGTSILISLHMTEGNVRGIMNVVMMSLDVLWGFESPAAGITFYGVGV